MKTIVNKTMRPMKLSLPGGKVLHLGPAKTGQISDPASEAPSIRKLVKAGDLEIVGEGEASTAAGQDKPVQTSSSGHAQTTVVHPKGNR